MSSESQKSVSYVMTKSVSTHMEDDVLKLPSFTPTQQAVTELQRYERDDIIVTDASGKAIGIVTDQDILNKVSDKNVYAETTILEDIMSSPLITVTPGTQIQNALRIMRDRNVRKLKKRRSFKTSHHFVITYLHLTYSKLVFNKRGYLISCLYSKRIQQRRWMRAKILL